MSDAAVGELANMLAGNLKAVLDLSGSALQLPRPSFLSGEESLVERLPNSGSSTVPINLDDGYFLVELQPVPES